LRRASSKEPLASASGCQWHTKTELQSLQTAARSSGWQTVTLNARSAIDIDNAFATAAEQKVGAVLVIGDPLFTSRRDQIVALAARYSIPANYSLREFVTADRSPEPRDQLFRCGPQWRRLYPTHPQG
jgi:hypothetical protein